MPAVLIEAPGIHVCICMYMYQERRKHFKIGQAIKNFLLAPLASFLNTITTCEASFRLADASWGLKLMVASFQLLKHYL